MFGSHFRYLCECGDGVILTVSTHCHGPDYAVCHGDAEEAVCNDGEKQSGDRKDHKVVKDEAQIRLLESSKPVVAPQVLVAIIPMVDELVVSAEMESRAAVAYAEVDSGPPGFGVTVARTVALLI